MTKKEIAQDFLKLAGSGQPRRAFELYIADDFKHHNAYYKGDRQTLMLAMEEAHLQNPNKVFGCIFSLWLNFSQVTRLKQRFLISSLLVGLDFG